MRRHTAWWLVLAFTGAAPATAQISSGERYIDPVNGLSLADAVQRALADEPSISAARLELDAASGRQQQATRRPNPMASFEWRAEPAGTDRLTMVGVEWPLDLFRRDARVLVAERERVVVARRLDDRARLLAASVRDRYGAVLAAVWDLQILEALVETTTEQRNLLRSRVEAGATPPLDRDLVDVELGRIEADRLLQAGRTDAALIELKRLLGMEPLDPLRLRQDLERLVQLEMARPADPVNDAMLVERRADVQQAMAVADAAEARVDLARQNGRVDVGLFGTFMRMDAGFPQFGFSPDGDLERVRGVMQYVSAGARIMLPVLNRGQGDVQAAQAERAAALATQAAASLQARSEVASARAADDAARQAVAIYITGRRALARQNLEVVRQSYTLGRVPVFEVLAEQRRWLEIERAYTDALRAAYEARTALERALGEMR